MLVVFGRTRVCDGPYDPLIKPVIGSDLGGEDEVLALSSVGSWCQSHHMPGTHLYCNTCIMLSLWIEVIY